MVTSPRPALLFMSCCDVLILPFLDFSWQEFLRASVRAGCLPFPLPLPSVPLFSLPLHHIQVISSKTVSIKNKNEDKQVRMFDF